MCWVTEQIGIPPVEPLTFDTRTPGTVRPTAVILMDKQIVKESFEGIFTPVHFLFFFLRDRKTAYTIIYDDNIP